MNSEQSSTSPSSTSSSSSLHQSFLSSSAPVDSFMQFDEDVADDVYMKVIIIIIIIIIITTTIFIVLSSWQRHCKSSLGSRDEYRNGARWPPTFGPSQLA